MGENLMRFEFRPSLPAFGKACLSFAAGFLLLLAPSLGVAQGNQNLQSVATEKIPETSGGTLPPAGLVASSPDTTDLHTSTEAALQSPFRRGDANADGSTNLSDSVYTLLYLFEGSAAICEKALDTNDDGQVNVSDALRGLRDLFGGASQPRAPFLVCGMDPTPDTLNCPAFPICSASGDSKPTPPVEREGNYRWSYAYGEGRTSLVEDATRCAAMLDPTEKNGRKVLESALERVGGFAGLHSEDRQEYPGLWYPRFLENVPEEEHLALIEKLHTMPGVSFAAPLLIYGKAVAIARPEIIVTADADAQEEDLFDILSQPDLHLIREFPSIDSTFLFAFDGSPAECFARCDELNRLEAVFVAEPNMIWDLPKMTAPNDPLYSRQWDLNNTGQTGGTVGADMGAEAAWEITTGSASIIIAICDEGVDVDHPDLAANMIAGRDSVTADPNPPSVPGDAGGNDAHGTCCAGIAAAVGDNGIGVSGINWNAKIMPIRLAFGDFWTSTSWIIDAVTWAADNGADVQSHSWGGNSASTAIENAFNYATTTARGGLGSACFCATGNENSSVGYPAKYDSTVAVGATSPCDERKSPSSCDGEGWWGSNFGPEVDVCAPGPLVTTTDIAGSAGYTSTDYINNFNGTSSATPHAAGAGALLLSVQPSLTASQVQQYMEESADDQVGISSEDTPGHDNYMGWGRVNLVGMLALAGGGVAPPTGLTCVENEGSVDLSWTNGESYSSIIVARNGVTIATLNGSETSYTDTTPGVGNVTHRVTGTLDGSNSPYTSCSNFLTGGATDLVFAPPNAAGSVNGGQGLVTALNANGRFPLLVSSLDAVASLDAFEAVWVSLGIFSSNHILTAAEGSTLDAYLTNGSGGSFLYLEGGDTWAYDSATAVHSRFGISGIADGSGDLSTITGVAGAGCDLAGSSWSYTGENSWIDHLSASGTGTVTLSNAARGYNIGIFNDGGSYRTFGTSFEIGGIGGTAGAELVAGILACFAGAAPPPPTPPTASFTRSPSSGDAPLAVNFTDTSSGSVDSWDWSFGDGGTSSAQSPSHTYTSAGSYTVTLTVAGPAGSDATTCSDCVTVTEPPPPPPEAPIAGFTYNPPSGDAPLAVAFVDLSTGAIDSWDWNFGDGGTSSEQNPSYTYTAAGNYTVTLTVTNTSASDTATCNDCITVTEPPPPPPVAPIADFTFNPSSGEAPLAVSFTDISSGAIDSWNWNFGDGDTSSAQSPSHTYTAAGNYTVTLTVTGPGGSDTVNCFNCIAITEPPPPPPAAPIADFTLSEIGGEAPVTVAFTDLSTGAIDTWDWNFGDSGTSSEQNPSHTYTEEGSYTVTLTVTGPGGSDTVNCFDCVLVTSPPEPPEPPSASAKIYISFKGTASVPGVGTVRDEDIVSFDPDTNQWEMYFDGSDVGLASTDVDAFSVRADGSIVLSVNSGSFSVAGLIGGPSGTTIDDSDMIEFTPVATGNTTAGSFTFLFDGSDVGLTTNGEDIDGVCWLEDGTFLFSTQGTTRGNGPRLADEDVAVFFPSALGSTTGGTWEKFFDGSNVGYSQSSQEDIDGFSLTEDQSLLMSTVGSASASGVSGSDEDLFLFSGTFGSPTSGSSSIAFILSSLGIDTSEDVDGVSTR
jgi:PKD repeat protein